MVWEIGSKRSPDGGNGRESSLDHASARLVTRNLSVALIVVRYSSQGVSLSAMKESTLVKNHLAAQSVTKDSGSQVT